MFGKSFGSPLNGSFEPKNLESEEKIEQDHFCKGPFTIEIKSFLLMSATGQSKIQSKQGAKRPIFNCKRTLTEMKLFNFFFRFEVFGFKTFI